MKENDEFGGAPDLSSALASAAETSTARRLEIDVEKYQAYLDDQDLTPAQKEEIIHALWSIMVAFVELGFGVHPAQLSCGQLCEDADLRAGPDEDVVNSDTSKLSGKFNGAPERR